MDPPNPTLYFTDPPKPWEILIVCGAAGGLLILMLIIIIVVTCHHKRKNRKLQRELTEKRCAHIPQRLTRAKLSSPQGGLT